ncbi:MAG: urease accessory protein UreF [Rhodospirillales bacterium]
MEQQDATRILYLLQVATAAFPTGAFNHSYGFETWIDREQINDAASFEVACRDWLQHAATPLDGVAVAHAQRFAVLGDAEGLITLDGQVGAMRLTRESRDASVKTGRSFLNTLCDVFETPPVLTDYVAAVRKGTCEGHQAVGFGAAAGVYGLSTGDSVLAHLQSSLSNLASVAARLVPLGQVEIQRILKRAWPLLMSCTEVAERTELNRMSANMVSLDVASMHHESLHTRLCMS